MLFACSLATVGLKTTPPLQRMGYFSLQEKKGPHSLRETPPAADPCLWESLVGTAPTNLPSIHAGPRRPPPSLTPLWPRVSSRSPQVPGGHMPTHYRHPLALWMTVR